MDRKAVLVLSGGQDSTTCAFWARERFAEVHAITFNYGQRHAIEIGAANIVGNLAHLDSGRLVEVPGILLGSSPLVSNNDLEQYKDHHSLPGGLEKTFVPGRNMLFLLLAANYAYSKGITEIITGVCQEDFGGYPDCRQVFIDAMEVALRRGMALDDTDPFAHLAIHTPLMDLTKAESVKLALQFDGCFSALGFSHTSYDGAYPPTGHDHATLLRAKGFEEAGLPDPLVVRAFWEKAMDLPDTLNYTHHRELIDSVCLGFVGTVSIATKFATLETLTLFLKKKLGFVI